MIREDRLLDLLVARATEGLSERDSLELDRLLGERDGIDGDELDLAAAAAYLAFRGSGPAVEPMPLDVKHRTLAAIDDYLASRRTAPRPRLSDARYLGWYAAAAMLLLALWAPWNRSPELPATKPTLEVQRQTLVREAGDTIRIAWATPDLPEYAGVGGDVVWSGKNQAGFMRLRGLPANDSDVEQYQLWIVDPARDEHPIDGGVFDIPAGADEVIVPIDAKLEVVAPRAFAITLEQPGGVVVSDGPLLVVAPVRS